MSHPFTLWTVAVALQQFTYAGTPNTACAWMSGGSRLSATDRRLAIWTGCHPLPRNGPVRTQFCGLLPSGTAADVPNLSDLFNFYSRPVASEWKGGDLALSLANLSAGPLERVEECRQCNGLRRLCPVCQPGEVSTEFDPACPRCAGAGTVCDECEGSGLEITPFSETLFSLGTGEHHFSRPALSRLLQAFGPAEWVVTVPRAPRPEKPNYGASAALCLHWPQASAMLAAMTRRSEPSALEMHQWRAEQQR